MSLDAIYYSDNSVVQKSLAEILLLWHSIKKDEVILDIGCGDGAITAKLSKIAEAGTVIGMYTSEEMIALARKTFPPEKFKNLYFQWRMAEIPYEKNDYSLITAFSSLHWINDVKSAFQQMHDALLPNGKVLALTYPAESPYWKPFIEVLQHPKWKCWQANSICGNWLTSDNYRDYVQAIGFNILRMETSLETVSYDSKSAFKAYVLGWLPCLLKAPETILLDYLNEVTESMWNQYGHEKSGAIVPYKKLHLYLKAEKVDVNK